LQRPLYSEAENDSQDDAHAFPKRKQNAGRRSSLAKEALFFPASCQ
jgi:hypothetical protein